MTDISKKNFIYSLKRLSAFFNNLKEYKTGDERDAEMEEVTPDDMDEKIHPLVLWKDEATIAIRESKRFQKLIEN